MIKIASLTTCWKRPGVTELMFMGLERLKKHPKFDITSIVVLSPEDPNYDRLQDMANDYGHFIVTHPNKTLGQKKNHGLRAALTMDFDYLLDIDSDNVVSNELLDKYYDLIQKEHKFFGTTGYYIADQLTSKCYEFHGFTDNYAHGTRMMHRSILIPALWPEDKNAGMDMGSGQKIYQEHGIYPKGIDEFLFVDVKTATNLHLTMQYRDRLVEVEPETLKPLMSGKEYDKMMDIISNPKPVVF